MELVRFAVTKGRLGDIDFNDADCSRRLLTVVNCRNRKLYDFLSHMVSSCPKAKLEVNTQLSYLPDIIDFTTGENDRNHADNIGELKRRSRYEAGEEYIFTGFQ